MRKLRGRIAAALPAYLSQRLEPPPSSKRVGRDVQTRLAVRLHFQPHLPVRAARTRAPAELSSSSSWLVASSAHIRGSVGGAGRHDPLTGLTGQRGNEVEVAVVMQHRQPSFLGHRRNKPPNAHRQAASITSGSERSRVAAAKFASRLDVGVPARPRREITCSNRALNRRCRE
jgi:hypothetical protein